MNEHDQLAAELAALRPLPPSRELKQQIAAELTASAMHSQPPAHASRRHSHVPLWLAALSGPIAACLIYFLLRGGPIERPPTAPSDLATQATISAAFDDNLPSLWSYRRAADRSFDELDALLDKHAMHFPGPTPQRAGAFVSAFGRSDSQLEDLLGEL
jgi:hypothetical protein